LQDKELLADPLTERYHYDVSSKSKLKKLKSIKFDVILRDSRKRRRYKGCVISSDSLQANTLFLCVLQPNELIFAAYTLEI
jgi:hypothetical protein